MFTLDQWKEKIRAYTDLANDDTTTNIEKVGKIVPYSDLKDWNEILLITAAYEIGKEEGKKNTLKALLKGTPLEIKEDQCLPPDQP